VSWQRSSRSPRSQTRVVSEVRERKGEAGAKEVKRSRWKGLGGDRSRDVTQERSRYTSLKVSFRVFMA
jgi:hypothetical protein